MVKKTISGIFWILVGVGTGLLFWIISGIDLENGSALYAVLFLGGFLLGMIPFILIHELGHFVFGKITRYRLISFRIPFLMVYRNAENRLKISFCRPQLPLLGQCLMIPPKKVEGKKEPFFLFNAGGLVFSYIWFIGTGFLLGLRVFDNDYIQSFLVGLVIMSFILTITNSIPGKNAINDVQNARLVRKNPETLDAIFYQMEVLGNLAQGKKFSAPTDHQVVYCPNFNHLYLPAWLFQYQGFIELEDMERAHVYYERLKQNIYAIRFPGHRMAVIIQCILHAFLYLEDLEAVKVLFYQELNDAELKQLRNKKHPMYFFGYLFEDVMIKHQSENVEYSFSSYEKLLQKSFRYSGEADYETFIYNRLKQQVYRFIEQGYQFPKEEIVEEQLQDEMIEETE